MRNQDKKILESLTLADLQDKHREIAEVVGIEGMLKLCKNFGGSGIYIPQQKELIKNKVYANIVDEYDGTNIKTLAVKYDVSEATVYNIVRDKISKSTPRKLAGQMSIEDFNL